jgi:hypothetical protein
LGKESPEMLLEYKKELVGVKTSGFSETLILLGIIAIVDIIAGIILSMITKILHFQFLGSLELTVLVPWWLAFINGFVFMSYGIFVIKRKKRGYRYWMGQTSGIKEIYN